MVSFPSCEVGDARVRVAGCLLLTIHRFWNLPPSGDLRMPTSSLTLSRPPRSAASMTPPAPGSDGSLNKIPLRCIRLLTTATESLSLCGYVSTIRSRPPNPLGTSTRAARDRFSRYLRERAESPSVCQRQYAKDNVNANVMPSSCGVAFAICGPMGVRRGRAG